MISQQNNCLSNLIYQCQHCSVFNFLHARVLSQKIAVVNYRTGLYSKAYINVRPEIKIERKPSSAYVFGPKNKNSLSQAIVLFIFPLCADIDYIFHKYVECN